MFGPTERVTFIWGSAARREVLGVLAASERPRQDVVEAADASESAVYDAMNRLKRRGYVFEREDGPWALTGTGQAFTDLLERVQTVEGVVDTAPDYWATHDLSALPESSRRELHKLDGSEVIHSPETDPFRASRYVESAIEHASEVAIVSPVYDDRFASALAASPAERPRLILTPDVLRQTADTPTEDRHETDHMDIRVADAAFAMVVTGDGTYLSLPRLDGGYDPQTELVAESSAAVEWGREVYDALWADATPVEELTIA
ncbi:helix-turn-helix transcriptional regulator [Haloarchaeobius sp. DFWS5]|uniref:helix-turn-helix transcriptional regulator n=1 Tax=Haloarchaeobius sp. DFWS5 TaxID=3446114 RepID=UPI003EB9C41F